MDRQAAWIVVYELRASHGLPNGEDALLRRKAGRARGQLPLWSGQYTVMASLMNCAACALFIPCDSSSV